MAGTRPKPTPERIAAFSDGVLAIIITIMVLELKAPHEASLGALAELWPTFLSYALSYLFVGVFWVNHHRLLHHAQWAEPKVMWANLLVLFFVSLIPFFTAYMAENRMNSFTTALYAGIFLLVTLGFMFLQRVIMRQFGKRNWVALGSYAVAIPAAYLHPAVTLAIIVGIAASYIVE